MKRTALQLLRRLGAPLLIFFYGFDACTPHVAATDSDWLAPTSGNWQDGTRWSTAPLAPNAPGDEATIAAIGSPYTVLLDQNTSVGTVTLSSANATLEVNNATLTAPGGIQLDAGTLLLRGGTLKNTRVAGVGSFVASYNLGVSPKLDTVELAKNVSAAGLALAGTITLDNATLNTPTATLAHNGSVAGAGTWIVGPSTAGSPSSSWTINLPSAGQFTIGSGVEMKGGGNAVNVIGSSTATLVNRGVVSAGLPGDRFLIRRLRNEGTLWVSAGRMDADVYGNVGRVELTGGYLRLAGDLFFDQVVTVPSGATLDVYDTGNPLSSGQPIQLQAGGTVVLGGWQYAPRVNSTGGEVHIGGSLTLTQWTQLPVTGSASYMLTYYGSLDLGQGELDLDADGRDLQLSRGTFRNGAISSAAATARELGRTAGEVTFDNVNLDLPGEVSDGRVTLRGASALWQAVSVDGGRLILSDQWSNHGGVTVSGGTLELRSAGADFGSIEMTGGTLGISYATTLAEVLSFDVGSPAVVEIVGQYAGGAGNVNMEQATLDLESFDHRWHVAGTLRNGLVTGQLDGAPLVFRPYGTAVDVEFDSVRIEGPGSFQRVEARNSVIAAGATISMFGAASNVLTDVTIDGEISCSGNTGSEPVLELRGDTVLNGAVRGRTAGIRFADGATLSGTGELGNVDGRIQGLTIAFEADAFTIPAGITLVSATRYDSTDRINAPNTALHVAGDMLVGYTSTFSNRRTDSWTLDVASLETSGSIAVTLDGRLTVNAPQWNHRGAMNLADGLVEAEGMIVAATGAATGFGTIDTPNDSSKPLINNGRVAGASGAQRITLPGYVKGVGTLDNVDVTGTFAPGFSPATVTLGSVAYAGELEIEVGGTALGSFDRLEHTLGAGIAQLGGSLVVSLINGFVPALGDTFEFLTANGGVNGTFADETLPSLAGGLGWSVTYAANSVVLEVTAAPSFTADFDEDGDVDGADLLQWRGDFGGPGSDADNDGDSDGADFLAWQRQFGSSLPNVAASAAVPEPATSLLLVASLLLVRSLQSSADSAAGRRRGVRIDA